MPFDPAGDSALPAPLFVIDLFAPWADPRKPHEEPVSHLQWAENIARLIAHAEPYHFNPRGHKADDVVRVAHLILVRVAPRFDFARVPPGGDPNGQFRGFAHPHVKGECERECMRQQNGGTFSSTNDAGAKTIRVGGIPERCPNCVDVTGWGLKDGEDTAEVVAEAEVGPEPVLVARAISVPRAAPGGAVVLFGPQHAERLEHLEKLIACPVYQAQARNPRLRDRRKQLKADRDEYEQLCALRARARGAGGE